jgi:hypothetical protein
MTATLTLKELRSLREGVVGFVLSKTLSRVLGAPELLSGMLDDRPFIEKILPPHTGNARNWSTQQMLKDRRIFVLHQGKCSDAAWFECAIVLAVVGHLVLIDLEANGTEAGAEHRLRTLIDDADPQVSSYARTVFRGLIGRDGLMQESAHG